MGHCKEMRREGLEGKEFPFALFGKVQEKDGAGLGAFKNYFLHTCGKKLNRMIQIPVK